MSDGYSETGSDFGLPDDTPAHWMEGQALTPIDRITPVRVPDPLDPAAVLDAVRRISHQERRELTVLLNEGTGLLALPPFKAGEVPAGVPDAHLKQHNPTW
jgi:hypothetical protein